MTFTLALTAIAPLGCEPAAPPPPSTPSTQAAPPAPVATPEKPKPASIPEAPATKPPPVSQPSTPPASVGENVPRPEGDADLSKLPDRTQRIIRDTRKALADAPGSGDLPTRLGMIYLTNGFERDAVPLFRQAIDRVPGQAANWYYLGIALAATQDSNGAIAAFQKAVTLDKDFLYAHLRLANLLINSDKAAALTHYKEVDRLAPKDADTLIQLARGYDQSGKLEEAIAAGRKAVGIEPACPLAHAALAELLVKKGEDAEARQHQQMGMADGACNVPTDMHYLQARAIGHPTRASIMRAMALASAGNFETAIRGLKQLSSDDPMNLDVPLALGQVYQMQGNLTEAMNEYAQVVMTDPGHPLAALRLSGVQIHLGRFADAEKTLNKALAKRPDDPDLVQSLGIVQARTNRETEAIASYQRMIELRKGDPRARLDFAKMLLSIKRYPEATKELEPLMNTPLLARALITRSSVKIGQGDAKGAEEDMRAAIAASPNDPEPVTAFAVQYASAKQYDRATAVLEDGLKRHPTDQAIMNALAWLLATAPQASLRDGPRAVELARKCCDATNYVMHGYLDTLAASFAEAGKFNEAVVIGQKAVELARNNGEKQTAVEYESRLGLYSSGKPFRSPE